MNVRDAIEEERDRQMAPLRPWCTAEPCITIPLKSVLICRDRETAYITLADLAKCFETSNG